MKYTMDKIENQSLIQKQIYLKIATITLAISMFFFIILNIFFGSNYSLAALEFIIFIVDIYLIYTLNKSPEKVTVIFSFLMLILIIFICYFVPLEHYGLIWLLIFPVNSIYLVGKKRGILLSTLLFIFLILFFFYIRPDDIHYRISINILFSYFVITALSYMYQTTNDNLHKEEKSLIDKLNKSNDILEHLSTTDKLTGLINRSKIDTIIEYEIDRSKRYDIPLSFVIIDIDYFKKVNDTHGHQAGDTILIEFSKLLKEHSRQSDFVSRWGGEEFLAVLPNTAIEDAAKYAEVLRQTVEKNKFSFSFSNTCSIGISTIKKDDTSHALLERADKALYAAKNSGRNKVTNENEL